MRAGGGRSVSWVQAQIVGVDGQVQLPVVLIQEVECTLLVGLGEAHELGHDSLLLLLLARHCAHFVCLRDCLLACLVAAHWVFACCNHTWAVYFVLDQLCVTTCTNLLLHWKKKRWLFTQIMLCFKVEYVFFFVLFCFVFYFRCLYLNSTQLTFVHLIIIYFGIHNENNNTHTHT